MKISRIEHLGIAVKSIEESLPYYEQVLGFECYNIETVEDQKVRTAFLKVGETKIELLEATSPESTIAKFIENRGEGIHHIAYKVEDGVANALAECDAKEIRTIDKAPRAGAEGCAITFVSVDDQSRFAAIEEFIEREVFKLPVPEELGEAPEYAPRKSGGKGKGRGRGGKSNHRGGKGGGKGKTSHRNGKSRRGGKERKGAEPSTGKE